MKRPLVLCIMDGIGINQDKKFNAVEQANMPFWKAILKKYPHSILNASGTAVGADGTVNAITAISGSKIVISRI